jgi:hypothetical protein
MVGATVIHSSGSMGGTAIADTGEAHLNGVSLLNRGPFHRG